jgi:hypothetical protein
VCELSDTKTQYTKTLEDAYAVLAKVETMVDELGQELEYHHERLGKAMEPDGEES